MPPRSALFDSRARPARRARRACVAASALLLACCARRAPAPSRVSDGEASPPLAMAASSTSASASASAPAPLATVESETTRAARGRLVSSLVALGRLRTPRIIDAMGAVPRHLFVPEALLPQAYDDNPLPIGSEQTISEPSVVAIMTEALEPRPTDRVLEIGTGSGYQAAILAELVAEVYSIEILPELAVVARARLERLGYTNVRVRLGDGYAGWPELAPFDRILLTAAPPELPKALLAQLADGGVLVAPVGGSPDWQRLVRVRRHGAKLEQDVLADVRFVPMVPGR
jgi:protein-L-isoaspartate(D-aspartate) O-methyltransferase